MSDERIKKECEYLYDIYARSSAKVLLGEKIFSEYLDTPEASLHEIQIIIIDSLFHSAAVDICKILNSNEEINIDSLAKKAVMKCNSDNATNQNSNQENSCPGEEMHCKDKLETIVRIDADARERLIKKRNKSLVHSDAKNISDDFLSAYPLYIQDLDGILQSIGDALIKINKLVGNLYTVITFNNKRGTMIDLNIETQWRQIQKEKAFYEELRQDYSRKLKEDFGICSIESGKANG